MVKVVRVCGYALLLAMLAAPVTAAPPAPPSHGRVVAGDPFPVRVGSPVAAPAQQSQGDDPTGNGTAMGALVGAGSALALTAAMFAGCDAGCEGPSEGSTYLLAAGVGAGAGAVIGWIIDKGHKGQSRKVDVAPLITTRQKGVTIAFRF